MERNFLLALALSFAVLTLWTFYTAPPAGPPAFLRQRRRRGPPARSPGAPPRTRRPLLRPAPAPSAARPAAAEERVVTSDGSRARRLYDPRRGLVTGAHATTTVLPGRPRVDLTACDPTRDVALSPLEDLGAVDLRFAPTRSSPSGR